MELLICFGVLLGVALAALAVARRFELGVALVLVALLLDTLFMEATPGIDIGVWVYPKDVIFCLLLCAATIRLLPWRWQLRRARWIGVLLLLMFLLAFLRGLPEYSLKAVGNETRGYFPFLVALLYFSSFKYDRRRQSRLITIWLAGGVALGIVTVFRWIAANLGLSIANQWETVVGAGSMRVIHCAHGFYLATAFFFSLYQYYTNSGPTWQRRLFLVVGPTLVLLQHRTVWVAVILGMLWLCVRDARFRTRFTIGVAASLVVGALLTLLLFGSQGETTQRSLQRSASDTGTFAWRVEGWKALLADKAPPETLLIGQPFGAGFDRHIEGGTTSVSAHNFYLETLIQFGIPGVLLLFGLYVWSIGRLRREPRTPLYPDFRLWQAFLVMHLSYSVTYSVNYDQALLLAVVISVLSDCSSTVSPAIIRTRICPLSHARANSNGFTSHLQPV
ncbi:MAG TPA: O-antigen ligase family protein [Terriglobales bacterium]|nr:O-antigen ligase family protein [Terriglobales bacterium]